MTMEHILLLIAAVLAAWPFAMVVLAKYVHADRLEAAELGERLIQDEFLSEHQKRMVKSMLDQMTSGWPMVVMSLAFPVIAVVAVTDLLRGIRPRYMLTGHTETEYDYIRFGDLFLRSVGAANPLFYAVFRLQFSMLIFAVHMIHLPASATAAFLNRLFSIEFAPDDGPSGRRA
jgi:hypothetical protein